MLLQGNELLLRNSEPPKENADFDKNPFFTWHLPQPGRPHEASSSLTTLGRGRQCRAPPGSDWMPASFESLIGPSHAPPPVSRIEKKTGIGGIIGVRGYS